jgi:hypothetical protein
MSYLVAHAMKVKGNLRNVERHIERTNSRYSNTEIDASRTHLNYDAMTGKPAEPVNYQHEFEQHIEDDYKGSKNVRKDAVKMVSVLISSDRDFFRDMPEKQQELFFSTAAEYLAEKVGKKNIISAKVHLDETTPHMHFCYIPMTADGRLSAKEFTGRKQLKELQSELPKVLQAKGFKIERGVENSPAEHMPTAVFKAKSKSIAAEVAKQKAAVVKAHNNARRMRAGIFDSSEVVKLPLDDYMALQGIALKVPEMAEEVLQAERYNAREVLPGITKKLQHEQDQVKKLEQVVADQQHTISELNQKIEKFADDLKIYQQISAENPKLQEVFLQKQNELQNEKKYNRIMTYKPPSEFINTPSDTFYASAKKQLQNGVSVENLDYVKITADVLQEHGLSAAHRMLQKFAGMNAAEISKTVSAARSLNLKRGRSTGLEI